MSYLTLVKSEVKPPTKVMNITCNDYLNAGYRYKNKESNYYLFKEL